VPAFQAGEAGSTPAGHFQEMRCRFNRFALTLGDRLTVGFLPLKQAMEVRILLPESATKAAKRSAEDEGRKR
jgi:hypothetical protein